MWKSRVYQTDFCSWKNPHKLGSVASGARRLFRMQEKLYSYEEIKKEIESGNVVHVRLRDGSNWYLNEAGDSQERLYGVWNLCKKATRQPIYYDEIAHVIDIKNPKSKDE